MSNAHMLITITLIALTTIALRFLPFWIFPPSKQPPALITYLGKVLPRAAIALLVVYAVKDVSIVTSPYGLPELIAILAIVVVHVFKRNTLLSIATGTLLYMMLVQLVF
ncbi:branched-chain amino acid transporter AzlD [Aerococcaceae bacterium DSM 109653]|uniref:Branched-chain amino acid transporter AzlD n=1 Tax=Fundicoccus ignavus TaxID=2664442 RepID=A0A844C4I2_9LACT|nr:AzlD domain-containing protein [Fundicoccus ignavus]MRI82411.1 branched-chain amino acid transporter AzlD [Fundicoccus ignavus]